MKNKIFIGLTLTAVFLISAIFSQTITAESREITITRLDSCKVKKNNADFFVSATEKIIKLKKGTSLQIVMFGGQGVVVVKAKVGKKWIKGEIHAELTSCQ